MSKNETHKTFPAAAGNSQSKHLTPASGVAVNAPATGAPWVGRKWLIFSSGGIWEANLVQASPLRLLGAVRRLPNGNFSGLYVPKERSGEFFRRKDAQRFVELEFLKEGVK